MHKPWVELFALLSLKPDIKAFLFISFLTPDQKPRWQKSPNPRQRGARATSSLRSSSLSWAGALRSSTSAPQASVNPRQQGLPLHLSSPWVPRVTISPHFILQPWRRLGPLGICPKWRDAIPSQAEGLPHRQSQKSS